MDEKKYFEEWVEYTGCLDDFVGERSDQYDSKEDFFSHWIGGLQEISEDYPADCPDWGWVSDDGKAGWQPNY